MHHESSLYAPGVTDSGASAAGTSPAPSPALPPEGAGSEGEARFRKIFDHSNDGIFLIDVERDAIIDVNGRACALLGYSREELLGASMGQLHPHEIPQMKTFAESVLRAGTGFTDTLSCKTKEGRFVAAEISASTVEMEGRTCMIALVRDVSDRERLRREAQLLRDEIRSGLGGCSLVGGSAALAKVRAQIEMVAATEANVLVTGESGTGKELVARAIHERSDRRDAPLVKVNCASIPYELFESEFFGHRRGAFTGAVQDREGRFELADTGTIFLDEVGEIPLPLQGKLLRVLQERQFERIGESRTRSVDVRIVAATNRDLLQMSREGRFREDLYYRLSVFPIHIPPLRERPEDIAPLAERFVAEACARHGYPPLPLGESELSDLMRYDWPGNVRELQNALDRAVIVGGGKRLDLSGLRVQQGKPVVRRDPCENLTLADLKELERTIIERALLDSGGKIYGEAGAAQRLGLRPTTLASKVKKLGLQKG